MSDSPWDEFPDNGFLRDSHNEFLGRLERLHVGTGVHVGLALPFGRVHLGDRLGHRHLRLVRDGVTRAFLALAGLGGTLPRIQPGGFVRRGHRLGDRLVRSGRARLVVGGLVIIGSVSRYCVRGVH